MRGLVPIGTRDWWVPSITRGEDDLSLTLMSAPDGVLDMPCWRGASPFEKFSCQGARMA